MKLLTKTSLIFITISLFVFFISGILLYIILKKTSDNNINDQLRVQFELVSRNLNTIIEPGQEQIVLPYNTYIQKVDPDTVLISNDIKKADTIMVDPISDSYQVYRSISGYQQAHASFYKITVFNSLIPSEQLLEQLIISLTAMTVFLILGVFFVIKTISERIWSDFFTSLDTVKLFDLTKNVKINLPPSDVSEFNELNRVLNIMIARISSDFENLKEFTENITHEMQTPLAIIKSKVELMLQGEEITEEQAVSLSQIINNVTRLTRLNKGLVLLSRIENKQFKESTPVNITNLVRDMVENLDYLSESKNLQVSVNVAESIVVSMNKTLADILVTNMVKNAFIHSPENGVISISSSNQKLIIKNSGDKELNELKIFDRFVKGSFNSNSLGIGLSLVQKICAQYRFQVHYTYESDFHVFMVMFNENE